MQHTAAYYGTERERERNPKRGRESEKDRMREENKGVRVGNGHV